MKLKLILISQIAMVIPRTLKVRAFLNYCTNHCTYITFTH